MISSELIEELNRHRTNDVKILVPLESGGTIVLELDEVFYSTVADAIIMKTEAMFIPEPKK